MEHSHYLNPCILEFLEREKMAKEQERIEAEDAARLELQEHIYSYPDRTVYMGHMRVNDPENVKDGGFSHLRHGRGTLRTPAFVYGSMYMKNYTSDEAAENAHLAKWHEYAGTWENDKLHGYGVHVQKSGSGGEIVIFEGIWEHGKPTKRAAGADATSSDEIEEWKKDDSTPTSTQTVSNHAPGIKLTDEERARKGINHKYGICCSCDTGLDCCTEFIYYHHPSGDYALSMCVACNRYYRDTGTKFDFDNF